MIDIHMHIIPAVDDGSRDLQMSEAMLNMAYSEGIYDIIATPHSDAFSNSGRVWEHYAEVKEFMTKRGSLVTLALGCEVLFTNENLAETVDGVKSGRIPTLNATSYVLTEFRPSVEKTFISHAVQMLREAGFIPVIAHAERYPSLCDDTNFAEHIHNSACIQINAYSLEEEKDEGIKRAARMLLHRKLVDFVGSDAHRATHRAPNVRSGILYIQNTCDRSYARAVLWDNAKRLLGMGIHRYLDGLMGLAVGDALGVPFENKSLQEMKDFPCTGMTGEGSHHQPAGTWSDDTSMALCIADSLGTKGIDLDDVMKKFSAWKNRSQYTATGATFDVGRTCRKAIDRYDLGVPTDLCGNSTESGSGNGGLMRSFPIALYACMNCDQFPEMLNLVHSYSSITHAHPVGLICCGFYALFIWNWMRRKADETVFAVMNQTIEEGKKYYASVGGAFEEAINRPGVFHSADELQSMKEEQFSTYGYAVNTWNIAVWSLLNTDNYRYCVLKAVNLGGDADTNAAVAGSLAGFIYGREDIPAEWCEVLKNQMLIRRIADQLDKNGMQDPEAVIDRFSGDYGFLSMKYKSLISIDGITYLNLASAWLAQGVSLENRPAFADLSAHQARRLFKQLDKCQDWDSIRVVMLQKVALAKFQQNEALKDQLLATQSRPLLYDTTGSHDNFLGQCSCNECRKEKGQNIYGKTLMEVRKQLMTEPRKQKP